MADSNTYYPPPKFYFKVTFTGGGISGESSFQEVSGLKVDIDVQEVKEGGLLQYAHRLPNMPKYNNLVLKRGLLTSTSSVRTWIENAVQNFKFTPIQVMISLLGPDDSPLMSWTAYNVWPVSWEVDTFNSTDNNVAIESLELAFSYFKSGSSA